MRVTKNEIKNWMKENNIERAWLAKECGVSKATVDTWLSSDRGVPSKAQLTLSLRHISELLYPAIAPSLHLVENHKAKVLSLIHI